MRRFLIISLALFLYGGAGSLTAQAFQINQVQTGKAVLSESALDMEWTLTQPVDPDKSWITVQVLTRSVQQSEAALYVAAYFIDRRTVRIVRQKSGAELEVLISVAEFKSGVKVMRGITRFEPDIYQKRVVISRIQPKMSIVTTMATAPEFDRKDAAHLYFSAFFSDSNTLSIRRSEGAEIKLSENSEKPEEEATEAKDLKIKTKKEIPRDPVPEAAVYWQILEFFDGVKISQGIAKIPHFSKDTNSYLVDAIQDLDRAFLVYDWEAGHQTMGKRALSEVMGTFVDKGILLFTRPEKGGPQFENLDIQWKIVEMESASSQVQRGALRFQANESEKTISIRDIDLSRSMVFVRAAGGDLSLSVLPSRQAAGLQFIAEITDTGKALKIRRGEGPVAELAVDVQWTVVQFSPITLTRPQGGELWRVGEGQKITWDYSSGPKQAGRRADSPGSAVNVQLSLDEGRDDFPYTIASSIPLEKGGYDWLIPDGMNDQNTIGKKAMVRVKIRSKDKDADSFDLSKKPFEIKGVLKLIEPHGGETWHVGDKGHKIRWSYKGKIGDLSIFYDTQGGFGSNPFPATQRIARVVPGENGKGLFVWEPLPDLSSSRVRVKIVSEKDADIQSISEKDFSLLPDLKITFPGKKADPFDAEKVQMIKWESSGKSPFFNLYYRKGETQDWILTAKDIPGGEAGEWSYRWFVPPEAVSETLQLKIEKVGDPQVFGKAPRDGEGFFSVKPWVIWVYPSEEPETWRVGEQREVKWETGGAIQYFNFEYSTNFGETWVKEAVVRAQDKKYVWNIPEEVSDQVRIRLSDVKDSSIMCQSGRTLRIISKSDFAGVSQTSGGNWWARKPAPAAQSE